MKSLGIMYRKGICNVPISFSDSDYARDSATHRSTSGCITILVGGPVIWSSRKQECVSLSTTESEFVAESEAAKNVV